MIASSPPVERREVARKVAGMTLLVSLLGVVVITVLALVVLRRMRRRLIDPGRNRRTRHSDAWAEAGRRAGSPPAEAFESDRPILPDIADGPGPPDRPEPGNPADKAPRPSGDEPGGPYG